MAEIDGSIPASAGKNVPNLMANVGQIAQTMNAVNANRLFQAKAVAGQLLQRSIDPATGQPDLQTFNKLLSADPRTAPYASEALSTSIAQQTAGRSLQAAQGDAVRQAIGSLGPNANHDSVLNALGILSATKQVTPDFAATIAGNIPGDPAQINAWARNNFQLPALGAQAAMEAQQPKPTAINAGDRIDLITTPNAGMGAPSEVGHVDLRLSPGESASPRTVVGPDNVPRQVPTSALVTPTGQPKASALTDANGAVRTGLAPGVAESASVSGQQQAQMATALLQRASKVPDNKAILGNMEGLLENFTPGPQSGFWKNLNQLATQYGLAKPGSPPATQAAAQEEFGKLAFQLAQTQFQALGGTGTDAKLENTMHTSPSELLTRYGSKGIIALLKGNEDAVRAQSEAWQKWQDAGHGPETYGKFLNQWNRVYDPRVFQSVYQTPEARQTMLKGMTEAEKKQFATDYKRAVALGWIAP